jgi:RNA polymerase primary sigma factor
MMLREAMQTQRAPLSAAEETRLWTLVSQGDLAAKQRMSESNLGLVVSLARFYRGRGVPFEDLVQEGTVGLDHAIERFDHRRGFKFSTYAVWWIRRSLRDAVAASRMIRVPPGANRQLASIRRAEAELERPGQGPAQVEAIAARAGLDPQTVRSLRDAARVTASLDEPVGKYGRPLGELIADPTVDDPARHIIAIEDSLAVRRMLKLLPERHRSVVVQRYGLCGQPPLSHEEIGKRLGIGAERSRQLEHEALHRMRAAEASTSLAA